MWFTIFYRPNQMKKGLDKNDEHASIPMTCDTAVACSLALENCHVSEGI